MLWAIWIADLHRFYPEHGEPELYDEAGAFCRACAWSCPMTHPSTAHWAYKEPTIQRPLLYRAVPWNEETVAISREIERRALPE